MCCLGKTHTSTGAGCLFVSLGKVMPAARAFFVWQESVRGTRHLPQPHRAPQSLPCVCWTQGCWAPQYPQAEGSSQRRCCNPLPTGYPLKWCHVYVASWKASSLCLTFSPVFKCFLVFGL